MTKNLWFVISFAILWNFGVLAFPNCCYDVTDYAHWLREFHCNFSCDLSERPYESKCVSCLSNVSVKENYFNDSKSLMKPVIACQDVFYKLRNRERRIWGQVVLSWSVQNLSAPSLFSVEVRTAEIKDWFFLGMTNVTTVLVDNMDFNLKFMFRVTPFMFPNITEPSYTSDWIYLAGGGIKVIQSLNLSVVDFRLHKNSVQAAVEWTLPKEAPCSLLLHWQSADKYIASDQKILNLPIDSSPVIINDLLFQTKYFMTLSPIYQSDAQKVKSAKKWFVTPSCLTLTRENFTLCAPGPPLNLTASCINDTGASVSWLPPDYASAKNEITGYHMSVSEASERYEKIPHYKKSFAVEKNILNVTITDLKPGVLYIFEVQATSSGGVGPPVAVDFVIKEPVEMLQPVSYIPWHYIVPSSVFALSALLVALCINFSRIKKTSKYIGYPSGAADVPEHLLPHLLSIKKIDLHDVIGKGEFGVVHRGVYCRNKNKEIVAVKVFPSESVSRSKLLHEVEILHTIGRHCNIVSLIGFTMDVNKMCLVLEHCALGNLHTRICRLKRELSVIKKKLSDPKQPLIETYKGKDEHYGIKVSSYIHQIAIGMEYISSLNLIHRDLAARNILLSSEKHVKIADFGLAKDVSEDLTYTVSKQKKLPIRWMAPESLEKQIFSTHSDVWSFGVLVWEIFKFGKVPYSHLNNSALPIYLKNGYRLQKPRASSQIWYDLMLECWHINPVKRPTFRELVVKTEKILSKLCQYTVIVDS